MLSMRIPVLAGLVLLASPVLAMDDMKHHAMPHEGSKNAPSMAYAEANAIMHRDMTFPFTGDADIDFLKGMIAHHQGAVDMARVQLKYGKDVRIKRLSREIIRAQNLEIRWMKKWLAELEEKKKGYTDEAWMGDHTIGDFGGY